MSKTLTCAALAAFAASLSSPALAVGTNGRTFVSGQGADTGSCALTAPCRSFAYALTQTASGGEIVVLNSAGYGQLVIQQSVSIVNPSGVEAGISAPSGGSAITIQAGQTDVVSLRGLTLEGQYSAAYGITFSTGEKLEVTDCVIRDFTNSGIIAQTSTPSASVLVVDTRVLNNQNAGIYLTPTSNTTNFSFSLDRLTVDDNKYGIYIDGSYVGSSILGGIINTSIDNSSNIGLDIIGGTNNGVNVSVRDSNISQYFIYPGITVNNNTAVLSLYRTNIPFSSVSLVNGGEVGSAGNNDIRNGYSGGSPTSLPEQ